MSRPVPLRAKQAAQIMTDVYAVDDPALADAMQAIADRYDVPAKDLWDAVDVDPDVFTPDPCIECGQVHAGHHCGRSP